MNAMNSAESWVRICRVDDIPVLGARVVERSRQAGNIAVFRNGDDRVFALLDRCPHKGGPLSQGIVFGERVACPLHGWAIQLADGCATAPDEGCTQRFVVKVEGEDVYLQNAALSASGLRPEPSDTRPTSADPRRSYTDRTNTEPARIPADGV